MAIRRHLVLAPAGHRDRLGAAVADLVGAEPPESAGAWCWVALSAWAVERDVLRARLTGGPFLLFTTFDDDGWHLSASSGPGVLAEATHVFAADWREDDPRARTRVAHVAAALCSVAPGGDAPADLTALEDALGGRSLGPAETESALGDLPRVLHLLGAGAIVPIPEPPPRAKRRAPRPRHLPALVKGHGDRARSDVHGVVLEARHAGDAAGLALACEPDVLVVLVARGHELPLPTLDVPCTIARQRGDVVVEADGGVGLKLNVVDRAVAQLAAAPGLGELAILTGARGAAGKTLAWHRYVGPVSDATWEVREVTPAVDGATLAAALALVAARRGQGPLACSSAVEAEAVAAACRGSLYFTDDRVPKVSGDRLVAVEGTRFTVLMELLRRRFTTVWDTAAARRREDEEARAWRQLEELGRGRHQAAPASRWPRRR